MLALNTNQTSGNGGGLYANAGAYLDLQGNIQATSNHADGNGGFVYVSGGSIFHVDDYLDVKPQIWVNDADNGGAVYATGSNVYCDGTVFGGGANGNKATSGNGGAIYASQATTISDTTIGGEGVSVGQIAATRKMCPDRSRLHSPFPRKPLRTLSR